MNQGPMYLVGVMDWHRRKVLCYHLSNTLDTAFCDETLNEAMDRFGRAQIFNTDQGTQFISNEFTSTLKDCGIAISM